MRGLGMGASWGGGLEALGLAQGPGRQSCLLHWSLGCRGARGGGLVRRGWGLSGGLSEGLSGGGLERNWSSPSSLPGSAPSATRHRGPCHHRPDPG